jgi:hypothetical protein
MRSLFFRVSPLALSTALILGGCALTPAPLTTEELAANAHDKRQRVTANQEPIGKSVDLHQAMARERHCRIQPGTLT